MTDSEGGRPFNIRWRKDHGCSRLRGTYYTLTFQRQDRVVLATLSQRRCGVYHGGGVAEKSAQLGYEDGHFYEHDRAQNRERSPYLSQKRGAMDSQPGQERYMWT